MIALVLVVLIGMAAFHWLMAPVLVALLGPLELHVLPWLALALGVWFLSGDPSPRSDRRAVRRSDD
ncbi:MAG: hypothetical protein VKK94_04750 [Cyanobacteriota bacterium]|nr:hypothetical protein [Cyanobacteriota bacterium]